MTRKELAEGIIDVSTVVRIEKGNHVPRIDTLMMLCSKLNIPLYYILNPKDDESIQFRFRIKQLCREFVYYKDFDALKLILEEADKKQHQYEDDDFKRFISWHNAILMHKKNKNLGNAEHTLTLLMPQNYKLITETDIGIANSNSLGLVYLDLKKIEQALDQFNNALAAVEQLPFLEDKTLVIRVGYNCALVNYLMNNYNQVISFGNKVLYYLDTFYLKYMLGHINHLLGITHENLGDLVEAEVFMVKATHAFLADSHEYYYVKSLRALSEIQFKAGKIKRGSGIFV